MLRGQVVRGQGVVKGVEETAVVKGVEGSADETGGAFKSSVLGLSMQEFECENPLVNNNVQLR